MGAAMFCVGTFCFKPTPVLSLSLPKLKKLLTLFIKQLIMRALHQKGALSDWKASRMSPTSGTSAATDGSSQRMEEMLPTENHEKVLSALANRKSMAFLELTSICNIEDNELRIIITDFEQDGLVKIVNPDNVFDEVITLREKGFRVARMLSSNASTLRPSYA